MRIRILTVSVLRFGIISSLPWSRAGARILARESTSSHQPIRNENAVASSLYTFGHQTFRIQKVAGLYDLFRDESKPSLMSKVEDREFRPRVSPIFFKSRSNVSVHFLTGRRQHLRSPLRAHQTLGNHRVYCALFETRATNSSNRESKSFRMGDLFDFL
jgi:hypothetical protein